MKLWIAGVNGLLGSTLYKAAAGNCLGTGHSDVDIGEEAAVKDFVNRYPGITHIVNCAAFSLVDLAESKREEAYRANALGPENLAKIAKESGIKLVHISTDYVFPGDVHRPLVETDPVGPCNYYGQTKLEGEEKVRKILPSACIVRTSWIFGEGGKNFVAKLLQLLMGPNEIRLTDDHWGRPTYAPDLADALLRLLDSSGTYHFANAGVATKYEFGLAMRDEAAALGFPIAAKSILAVPSSTFPSPCKRPAYSGFNTAKIEKKIQIRSWKEALREYLCKQSALFPISL